MKKFLKISTLIVLFIGCQLAFAQDDVIREERKASGYSSVKASGIANVYLKKGGQEKVVVEVNDKRINDRLRIEVVNHVLVIRMENDGRWENRNNNVELKVYVTYKELNGLKGSGATNFNAEDEIKADQFELELSGANNSKLNLNANKLVVETSGASNATLSGEADKLQISTSGASNVKAYDLKAAEVDAESSGVSNIYVSVQDKLEVNANGLSNINYKGSPKLITREVSKMASVKNRN